MLGGMAHKALGRIFGRGEYKEALAAHIGHESEAIMESATPEVNSLVAPVSSNDTVPIMHMDQEGTVRITRREFIRTIAISDVPENYEFNINPGRINDFPWLHAMARNFQQYAFIGFATEYVPTSGFAVGSSNAALGFVSMAYLYNVIYDSAGVWPTISPQGILNTNGAMSCSPAAPGTCYMECDPKMSNQPVRFVYTEDPGNLSLFYSEQNLDAARLVIRTEGSQSGELFTCGQIWFTYEILLMQPRPQNPGGTVKVGKFQHAVELFLALSRFRGPMTDREAVLLCNQKARLAALFRTLDFVDEYQNGLAARSIHLIDEENKIELIPTDVLKVLQREEQKEASAVAKALSEIGEQPGDRWVLHGLTGGIAPSTSDVPDGAPGGVRVRA